MKPFKAFFTLAVTVSLATALSASAQNSAQSAALGIESDSGIKALPYSTIEDELDSLVKAYPDTADKIVYGISPDGNPLLMIRIAKKKPANPIPNPKAIFVGGSVHGDEYLAIEDRLPRYILQNAASSKGIARFLDQGGVAYMVPVLNPDGFSRRERVNTHGKDLNRDFTVRAVPIAGFSEVETLQLFDYIDLDLRRSKLKLAVTLDYHCCIGALLYPWSFKPAPELSENDRMRIGKISQWFSGIFGPRYQVGTTPELLGYSATGTSKDFFYERYRAAAFAFQGLYKVEAQNFAKHAAFWERIIEGLAADEI